MSTQVKDGGAAFPEWQPIETAPKTGEWILLGGFPYTPFVLVGHWGLGKFNRKTKSFDGGWSAGGLRFLNPTHWMPLPPPASFRARGADHE